MQIVILLAYTHYSILIAVIFQKKFDVIESFKANF